VSSSMGFLTTDSSPGASHFTPLAVRPCSCSSLTTLHIGALEEGTCSFLGQWNLAAGDFTLVIGMGLLLQALPFCIQPECLAQLSSSHCVFATTHPSEICLAPFVAEVYRRVSSASGWHVASTLLPQACCIAAPLPTCV
jgi:hypothetical protein